MHFLLLFFIEIILKTQGNKLIIKGYIKEMVKLIKLFLIKNIWVFLYTALNEDK